MSLILQIQVLSGEVREFKGLPFTAAMNVQALLEAAVDNEEAPQLDRFVLEYFGSEYRYELTSLDGISNQTRLDNGEFLYWELFVNGDSAEKGIDEIALDDGDTVRLQYVTQLADQPVSDRRAAIRTRATAK